ncbi:unnamed protein product [Rotaria sp. Silwood2]|nr:unnamed protein product [Rotaria sp. Silwood2]CAF4034710.1 unnamed protein product [Rotaria sp. Silwood2]
MLHNCSAIYLHSHAFIHTSDNESLSTIVSILGHQKVRKKLRENLFVSLVLVATASDFQRLHNTISTNLAKINSHTNDIERLVEKLGTQEDSEPLQERYFRLQNETKLLMQETNHALQQLQSIPIGTAADQRRRKNLAETLPKQYLAVLNRYKKAQHAGAKKEKESLEYARAVTYRQQNVHESHTTDIFDPLNTQLQQQSVLSAEQEVDLRGLSERGEQLRQIETNIVEVNELFKDVAKMVHEHGEIIGELFNPLSLN